MKGRLRKEMKDRLAAMPAAAAARKSQAACEALQGLEEYRKAEVVMLYAPIPGELDCGELVRSAWREGKTVLLPRLRAGRWEMIAVPWRSPQQDLTVGVYGIREPADEDPWPVGRIDFLVVPALAYDRRGNRLGRGKGCYDRFLAQRGLRAVRCGLAFDEQIVEELPVEANDYPVEILVTDRGVMRFDSAPSATGGTDSAGSGPVGTQQEVRP